MIYKMLMLTYKSYYNMAQPYLCELINKKESHVNTRLGTDHNQLIQLVRIVLTLFLSVHSFMLLHANKLSEHNRTSNFDFVSGRVLKQCYLHNNKDADCKCIYYCYL